MAAVANLLPAGYFFVPIATAMPFSLFPLEGEKVSIADNGGEVLSCFQSQNQRIQYIPTFRLLG